MLRNRCAWGCWCISSGLQSVGFSLNLLHYAFSARRCFVIKIEKWCRILGADSLSARAEQIFVQLVYGFVQHLLSWSRVRTAGGQIIEDYTSQTADATKIPAENNQSVESILHKLLKVLVGTGSTPSHSKKDPGSFQTGDFPCGICMFFLSRWRFPLGNPASLLPTMSQ